MRTAFSHILIDDFNIDGYASATFSVLREYVGGRKFVSPFYRSQGHAILPNRINECSTHFTGVYSRISFCVYLPTDYNKSIWPIRMFNIYWSMRMCGCVCVCPFSGSFQCISIPKSHSNCNDRI